MSLTNPRVARDTRRSVQEISGTLTELRQRRGELTGHIARVKGSAESMGSGPDIRAAADQIKAFQAERDGVEAQIKQLEGAQQGAVSRLANGIGGGHNSFGGHDIDPNGLMAEQFSSPDFQDALRGIAGSKSKFGDIELGRIDRESLARIAGGALQATGTNGIPVIPGTLSQFPNEAIVPYPTPPSTFLDLVPSNTIDQPTLPYAQEIPETGDPGPAAAAPGTTKPTAGIGYEDATTASTTVAGFVKANRQSLADIGQLQQAIQQRLLQKLRQSVEHLVLTGDGSVSDVAGVPGIKGILETTGIGSVDATGVASEPDALLDAIKTCLASGANPNAIVVDLNTWAAILKSKASGSGEYVASPFLSAAKTIWDVAFLPSVALGSGTAIVIDTSMAMTLLFREGASVILGLDSDDLTKNRVTLLVECRAMLPIWVPTAACEVINLGVSS